jgi:hypothetical protein
VRLVLLLQVFQVVLVEQPALQRPQITHFGVKLVAMVALLIRLPQEALQVVHLQVLGQRGVLVQAV